MYILKARIKTFFTAFISALFLYFIFTHIVSLTAVWHTLAHATYSVLISGLFILIVNNGILTYRWLLILRTAGFFLPYKKLCAVFFANLPIAKFSPGYTGDFMRTYFLREEVPVPRHVGIIGSEALLDVCALLIVSLCIGFFIPVVTYTYLIATGVLLVMIGAGIIFLMHKKHISFLGEIGNSILQGLTECLRSGKKFFIIFCVTLLSSILLSFYVWILFLSLGVHIPLSVVLAFQPLVTLFTLLPISLWGIGLRESVMIVLYTPFASSSDIITVGLLYAALGSIILPLLTLPFTMHTVLGVLFPSARNNNKAPSS
jgi:glycosyltransferase 2 family protein